jgi:hypothetical protein
VPFARPRLDFRISCATQPHECLLHHVLGFADAAEHAVGNRETEGPQIAIEIFKIGYVHRGSCHCVASLRHNLIFTAALH